MNKFILLLLLALPFAPIYGQNTLSGTITDFETTMPLENVSVYFPKLEKGAVTDSKGNYSLSNLPEGTYRIVVSYIGYQTYSKSIVLSSGDNPLKISLTPSAIEIEEVIVSTPFHKLQRDNVMKVEQVQLTELKKLGAATLAQGITNIPGVESISTGVGIGKPVIRGLSANRVLVYTQGIRLENQQFGDEHGLGVDAAGIESVEVIKGPASLLYGSDALGGVIYLNPERFAPSKKTMGDINLNYFTNTIGYDVNAGVKSSGERFKFLARASTASHVDYSTGDKQQVTNSRFNTTDLKAAVGYQASIFKTDLRYNFNKANLGLPEAIETQTNERSPDLPNQEITSHLLSSKTNVFFKNSSLSTILGYSFNDRKEFEEGEPEEPALHMELQTLSYNVQYNLPQWGNLETIVGVQGMHQTNENFGEEVLIPDATINDVGVLATSHLHFNKGDLQLGIRYDHRSINGEESGVLGEEGYIATLNRDFSSFNAAIGYKAALFKSITTRLNLASGFRAPNLAELTSNGVHEGTNRFEIGNPDLKNEQNLQIDLAFEFQNEHIELYVNGFYNTITDYIFVVPNGDFVEGDAVFLYEQQDANLFGGEAGFHWHPHPLDWLHVESSFQTVIGELDTNENLPLIPANSWNNTLRVEFLKLGKTIKNAAVFVNVRFVMDQNNNSDFETPTNGYQLLNIGFNGRLYFGKQAIDFNLSGNNLLNESYVSHLSRLKTDNIANIGRNVTLGVRIPL